MLAFDIRLILGVAILAIGFRPPIAERLFQNRPGSYLLSPARTISFPGPLGILTQIL